MSTSAFEEGEYLTCPFDPVHKVLSDNFRHHIQRCSQVNSFIIPFFHIYPLFFFEESSKYQNNQMSFQWRT
jgi:hypothetical protein